MVICLFCVCPLHSLLTHTIYDREAIIGCEEAEICEVELHSNSKDHNLVVNPVVEVKSETVFPRKLE